MALSGTERRSESCSVFVLDIDIHRDTDAAADPHLSRFFSRCSDSAARENLLVCLGPSACSLVALNENVHCHRFIGSVNIATSFREDVDAEWC